MISFDNILKQISLTALLVQDDLSLELPPLVQGLLHLRGQAVAGLAAVQEVTHAALLHQLAAGEASQLTEAIRAVDDGVEGLDLGVPQDKVTVCREDGEQLDEHKHPSLVSKTKETPLERNEQAV